MNNIKHDLLNEELKFSHVYLNYDPLSKINRKGKPVTILNPVTISDMKTYDENNPDWKNRVQMSCATERLYKDMENVYQYWNGCVWVDIDYKKYPNATEEEWKEITNFVNSDIAAYYSNNFYYYETSRSKLGGHYIFYFDVDRTESNFKKYSSIAREIVYSMFMSSGYEEIINYDGVFDKCCTSIFQCVYITKIDSNIYYYCNGATNDSYLPNVFVDKKENKNNNTNDNIRYEYRFMSWHKPDKVKYIEHITRWRLFNSLSRIFKDDELKREWIKCANMIPEKKNHTTKYYEECPYTNDWSSRINGDEYCDLKLLESFGYRVMTSYYKKTDKIESLAKYLIEMLEKNNDLNLWKQK